MTLSTIRDTLAELGVEPTKSLGQNFLHDQNLAAWIVTQLALEPGDHLVEVGPGLGALTEHAVPRAASSTLIEKDGRLAGFLRTTFPQADVIHGDALRYDTRRLYGRGPVRILGNLPYYASSQLLFQFAAEPLPVVRLVCTLQRELAARLAAAPRTKDYGALTLILGRVWRIDYLRTLSGSVFTPAPKVESGVVALTRRPPGELPDCDGALFDTLVKVGFSQRRKQMRKLLAPRLTLPWADLCRALEIEETSRAEELSLAQWIALTNLSTPPAPPAQDVHGELFDVVDETNTPIRVASRHEVHTHHLLHRAVHIFVFNRVGELFLQKRSRWKDAHPGRWDSSAAGHVNAGDTPDGTAPRELSEELGVTADCKHLASIPASERTGHEFVELYRAEHDGPFTLPRAEIETGHFFSLDQITRWIATRPADFATGFLECFHAIQFPSQG